LPSRGACEDTVPVKGAPRAFRRHDPRQAGGRLLVATAAGAYVALACPSSGGLAVRGLAGWAAAALVMSGLGWSIIARASPERTRRYAAADDPGRTAVWIIVLIAGVVSLFGAGIVLRRAHAVTPHARDLLAALSMLAVAAAWLLTHTAYTLRYAHLYYRDDAEGEGGLAFPGTDSPCYFDFAYFAFTIGMCFQVSDVSISSPQIRRAVLSHSTLSFVYNTFILALTLNLVLGAFG
jgi:uncharacterized membrane protein